MRKMRQIFWVAGVEFRKFLTAKNLILILFSFIFLGESVIAKLVAISAETGIKLNYLEPLNLILSKSFHAMIIPIAFIVLLSNFPDKSSGGIFMMVRMKRGTWILGQIAYAMLVGIFYLCFITVGSVIWIGKAGFFSTEWSAFMTTLYTDYPEVYATNSNYFIEAGTVTQGKPLEVFVISCIFMLFYLVTMAQILCLFKLIHWKRIGLFFDMVLTVFGAAAVSCLADVKWVFPLAHAIFGIHFRDFFAEPILPLRHSVWYFLILNILLGLVNRSVIKKCQIGDDFE